VYTHVKTENKKYERLRVVLTELDYIRLGTLTIMRTAEVTFRNIRDKRIVYVIGENTVGPKGRRQSLQLL